MLLLLALVGCGHRAVLRDAVTYRAETLAALERQREAAEMLIRAADAAKADGDLGTCAQMAAPALLIEAYAEGQAYRALWLADLPYPGGPAGDQPDPGPSATPRKATDYCAE